MLLGGRFSGPTVNDRIYQVIIYLLLKTLPYVIGRKIFRPYSKC